MTDSPHTPEFLRDISETANALADAARGKTLPLFRSSGLDIANKLSSGFDPVTEADRAAEQAMRAVLAERRPQDAIQGEEFGFTPGTSGFRWVLDPIDGTRAYMAGTPTWGTLIAICSEDGPVHGIIDQPFTGERWEGGAHIARHSGPHGDRDLSTRAPRALPDAILFSTFPEIGTAEERTAFERVSGKARLTRFGTDCYAYGLLAIGQIDLVIEAGLNDYDICAPIAVIEAAGGCVTDWQGGPAHGGGQVVAAANRQILEEALALLA
ncbi:inositol monophosphatase family protein [Aliiruegeria sabulilitoris]|uniref:inositol monophosphatase family protein n=1 Tax=Aliiruegeria sabulilitoris TaxID=1510458 RepID=UPI00082A8A68|nr:inositol monophosphatase family protein [Aliiruegeria sabulilitoris]NDR57975.1 inositol monophosphatase family protein [Pseudoruegeria sp. M32A2M]